MSETILPKVTFNLLPANVIDAFGDRFDLITGQQSAAATATTGTLYEDIQSMSRAEIAALFGAKSDLVNTIFQWLDANQSYSHLMVIPIADPSGAKAAGAVTFTGGPATADSQIKVSIVDETAYTVTISVAEGDTVTDIGDALVSAIGGLTNIPVTAVNTTGAVAITAVNTGLVGNYYSLKLTGVIAGVSTTTTPFGSGTGTPTLTSIFDVVGEGRRVQGVLWPGYWISEISVLENFLEARFNVDNTILRGFGFVGKNDTFANAKALADASNSRVVYYMGNNLFDGDYKRGSAIVQSPDYFTAYFLGLRSRRLTSGSSLADIIPVNSGLDDFTGGPALASLPYFNMLLANVTPCDPAELYLFQEQKELEESGFTIIGAARGGRSMITGQVVCPYKVDSLGKDNLSFHYLNYSDTGDVCTEIFLNVLQQLFSATRLTEGEIIEGRSMANLQSIKAATLKIYRDLSLLALTIKGVEAESFFATNTNLTADYTTGKVFINGPLPIVVQLRELTYNLRLSFTTNNQQVVF